MGSPVTDATVLDVGGGFAGLACAQHLAKHDVEVILLDHNNYHQFQPLLYQVATAQIAADDIARPLHAIFRSMPRSKSGERQLPPLTRRPAR